jgi:hypothetical protein
LKAYVGEKDETTSRTTSIQKGRDDEDIAMIDTTDTPTSTYPLVLQIEGFLARGCVFQSNYQVP